MAMSYVAWVLRSGALLSALLSSMPAWGRFDPIVVLVSRDRKNKDPLATDNPLSKAEQVFERNAKTSEINCPSFNVVVPH